MVMKFFGVASVVLAGAVALGGCGVAAVGPDDDTTTTRENPVTAADAGVRATDAGVRAGDAQAIVVSTGESMVCTAWRSVRDRHTQVATWSAGATQCAAGSLPEAPRQASIAWVNLYRAMAGLAPVAEAAADRAGAQGCAVMLERNGQLSHTPAATWACATDAARATAARSNLSGNPGFPMSPWNAVRGWIDESRDLSGTLGHRRWLLSPELHTVSYGQTGSFACLSLGLGSRVANAPQWVSWPPAGWVPTALMGTIWSFSKPGVSAPGTTVQVTRDGAAVAMAASAQRAGIGDDTVSWSMPEAVAGSVYRVRVAVPGARVVEYEVRPTGCGGR